LATPQKAPHVTKPTPQKPPPKNGLHDAHKPKSGINHNILNTLRKKQPGRGSLTLAATATALYAQSQDDHVFEPILVYLPLLAHGSGIGGVASSERLLKDFS
jgi:hypothetical protein